MTPIILGAIAIVAVWTHGYLTASQRFSDRIMSPWLRSIKVGDPHFWLRHRDYGAAWTAFVKSDWPFYLPKRAATVLCVTDATFDSEPQGLDRCERDDAC